MGRFKNTKLNFTKIFLKGILLVITGFFLFHLAIIGFVQAMPESCLRIPSTREDSADAKSLEGDLQEDKEIQAIIIKSWHDLILYDESNDETAMALLERNKGDNFDKKLYLDQPGKEWLFGYSLSQWSDQAKEILGERNFSEYLKDVEIILIGPGGNITYEIDAVCARFPGLKLYVVDVDKESIEKGAQYVFNSLTLSNDKVRFYIMNAVNLPKVFGENKINVIISAGLVGYPEIYQDQESLILSVDLVLKENGILIVPFKGWTPLEDMDIFKRYSKFKPTPPHIGVGGSSYVTSFDYYHSLPVWYIKQK